MIDDSAWSSQISLELSWQMAGYASPSKEKVCSLLRFSFQLLSPEILIGGLHKASLKASLFDILFCV